MFAVAFFTWKEFIVAKIAVIYHSGYGHTKVVAEHVVKGVQAAGVEVKLFTTEEATAVIDQFDGYDGIIFGAPTYMGGYSGQFKMFVDAASKVWFKQGWRDKIAAGFTNSGSPSGDKLHTLTGMWINAMQHSMIWVGTGMMPGAHDPKKINRLGAFGGLMTQSDTKLGPDQAPPAEDRETAELFGKRVAEATVRWVRGK
jgi:NAD(P)H dehydrogenase (quinone)